MEARRYGKSILVTINPHQTLEKELCLSLGGDYNERYRNYRIPYSDSAVRKLQLAGCVLDAQLTALSAPLKDNWENVTPIHYLRSKRADSTLPHQKKALGILVQERTVAWWHDMGTGKTKTATDAGAYLLDNNLVDYCLYLTTSSLVEMWTDTEMPKDTDYGITKLSGAKNDRIQRLTYGMAQGNKMFVTNYEGVRTLQPELMAAFKNKRVACFYDESTSIKDHTTEKFKCLWQVCEYIQPEYLAVLSGFPLSQSPEDIFGQFAFVDTRLFGHPRNGIYSFRATYINYSQYEKHTIIGYKNLDRYMHLNAKKAHRVSTEDAGIVLPPQQFQPHFVDLPPKLLQTYKHFVKENGVLKIPDHPRADKDGVILRCEHAFTVYGKAKQILNNFVYLDTYDDIEQEENAHTEAVVLFPDIVHPKMKLCAELMSLTDKPFVLWFVHYGIKTMIEKMLLEEGHSFVTLDRTIPMKNRNDVVQTFQQGKVRAILGQENIMSMGHTLTRANIAFYFERSSKIGNRAQSLKRIHRIGSEVHDSITYHDAIVNGTLDVSIYNQLNDGLELNLSLIDREEFDKVLSGSWQKRR